MLEKVIAQLEAEVLALNHELNVILPETLEKAIANGDLKENGDYHAALERQGFVQARLSQLRSRLVRISAVDVSKIPSDKVGLGSTVVVQDLKTKKKETWELVVPDAMDIDAGHISVSSPMGSAMLNKKKGDLINVRLPVGTRKLKIMKLKTLHDQA